MIGCFLQLCSDLNLNYLCCTCVHSFLQLILLILFTAEIDHKDEEIAKMRNQILKQLANQRKVDQRMKDNNVKKAQEDDRKKFEIKDNSKKFDIKDDSKRFEF